MTRKQRRLTLIGASLGVLAVAVALGIIEGEAVALQLMQLYQARVARTLGARGLLPRDSVWNGTSFPL